jgi:hypothetical protein
MRNIPRKPAPNAISATFLFRGSSSKSRVQAAIRLSLTSRQPSVRFQQRAYARSALTDEIFRVLSRVRTIRNGRSAGIGYH